MEHVRCILKNRKTPPSLTKAAVSAFTVLLSFGKPEELQSNIVDYVFSKECRKLDDVTELWRVLDEYKRIVRGTDQKTMSSLMSLRENVVVSAMVPPKPAESPVRVPPGFDYTFLKPGFPLPEEIDQKLREYHSVSFWIDTDPSTFDDYVREHFTSFDYETTFNNGLVKIEPKIAITNVEVKSYLEPLFNHESRPETVSITTTRTMGEMGLMARSLSSLYTMTTRGLNKRTSVVTFKRIQSTPLPTRDELVGMFTEGPTGKMRASIRGVRTDEAVSLKGRLHGYPCRIVRGSNEPLCVLSVYLANEPKRPSTVVTRVLKRGETEDRLMDVLGSSLVVSRADVAENAT